MSGWAFDIANLHTIAKTDEHIVNVVVQIINAVKDVSNVAEFEVIEYEPPLLVFPLPFEAVVQYVAGLGVQVRPLNLTLSYFEFCLVFTLFMISSFQYSEEVVLLSRDSS